MERQTNSFNALNNLEEKKQPVEKNQYISFEDGINRVNGNVNLYNDLLKFFIDKHKNDLKLVKNLYKDEEYVKMKSILHTLKGVVGNLGAKAFYNKIKDLEMDLNNTSFDEKNVSNTMILKKLNMLELNYDTINEVIVKYIKKNDARKI